MKPKTSHERQPPRTMYTNPQTSRPRLCPENRPGMGSRILAFFSKFFCLGGRSYAPRDRAARPVEQPGEEKENPSMNNLDRRLTGSLQPAVNRQRTLLQRGMPGENPGRSTTVRNNSRNISRKQAQDLGLPWAPPPDLRALKEQGREYGAELARELRNSSALRQKGDGIAPIIWADCPWPLYSREGAAWREGVNESLGEHHQGIGIRL